MLASLPTSPDGTGKLLPQTPSSPHPTAAGARDRRPGTLRILEIVVEEEEPGSGNGLVPDGQESKA